MAVTQNTYTGDGTTVLFSFTFPYLETTDIKVSLNGTITTAYTLANATTIQFNTAPANGAAIRIYRVTDDAALAAQFYPGSAIRSQDLNDNFTQNLYVTQESNREAATAITTAEGAVTTANGAVTTANAATATANTALSTANTASTNASAAVSTANTASTNASAAVSTANSAASDAATALSTANSAAADAATAISTANGAVTTANSAVSTANAATTTAGNAVTTANNAVSTANAASTTAGNAVTTANAAAATAASAVTTANGAVTTANSATSTANTALSTANAAASAVANAILYDTVANVAAIPASPANNDAVEVVDSTGIESFTPLSGKPVGYVGDSGLSVRLVYTTSGNTWNWIQYFPNDPENRYGDAIATLQSDVTAVEGDVVTLQGDVATLQSDVLGLDNSKAPTSNPTFTGAVKVADGTAAAPSITFASDTDLGLYRISENKMGLTSNGALVATIDDGQLIVEDSLWAGDNAWIETSGTFAVYQSATTKGTIRFYDSDESNYVSFEGPVSISSNVTWTLPSADGSSGQFLKTDGSGVLSWDTVDTSTLAPLASPTFTGTVTIPAGASIDGYLTTASATSTYAPLASPTFTGSVTFPSGQRYPQIPQNSQTAGYTLVASDAGKHVSITTGGVTVPSSVFAVGDAVSIYNNSSSSQTITASGVTLRQGGTANTGNRTLAQYGVASILCVAADTFVITGAGLS